MSEKDKALWRELTKGVKPLKSSRRVHHTLPLPSKTPINLAFQDNLTLTFRDHDVSSPQTWVNKETRLAFRSNGVQKKVLQRLKRGQYPITATLDLHGCTVQDAARQTAIFLQQAFQNQHTGGLRIIHGKGLTRPHAHAILKSHLNHWLQEHPLVLGFCSAPDHDGGTGVLYVLIRQTKD